MQNLKDQGAADIFLSWLTSAPAASTASGASGLGPLGLSWEEVFLAFFASHMVKDLLAEPQEMLFVLHHVVCMASVVFVINPACFPRGRSLFVLGAWAFEMGSLVNCAQALCRQSVRVQQVFKYGMTLSNAAACGLVTAFLFLEKFSSVPLAIRCGFLLVGYAFGFLRQRYMMDVYQRNMAGIHTDLAKGQ
eukprot:TRINITY_DN55674_c0_g1_i2.p1 TRINITY_DN55674_c0_g1~~TRINITY_DN55674_c0_g1_i2.p1  ORF type:complete len:191 (-),score=31.70 TRINITY_DN55674_c0_g1_i2:136-708(-)